jgi:hypothetical protein
LDWPDGAWRRISIAAGGEGPCEVSEVWWLQCDGWFADVRVAGPSGVRGLPYSETQAFAGRATYDAATEEMEWVCRLDSEERDPRSSARVTPCEGNPRIMREDGAAYTEYWGRMDHGDEPGAVAVSDSAVCVQVGRYAITVERQEQRVVGALSILDEEEWRVLLASDTPAPS